MIKSIKTLATLLIIGTAFTACKKEEATSVSISYPSMEGMYKVWASNGPGETFFDMEIEKVSTSYLITKAPLEPLLSNMYIITGKWTTDSNGRTSQALIFENNGDAREGKFYSESRWIEFYRNGTLMKARPWGINDTLILQDTTGSTSTEPTISYFNDKSFTYTQSSTRKFYVRQTATGLAKYESDKLTPTSEQIVNITKTDYGKWSGEYFGWNQYLGTVLLEASVNNELTITEYHINGKTYIATEVE